MTFLEFIRKNSLLVLIVIVAIAAGLIMMDYSNQGSAFSRDFHIQVNGTNYKTPDVYNLGESAESTIQQLVSQNYTKLRERFDTNNDDDLSADEQAALNAWLEQHPEVEAASARLQYVLNAWCYGLCKRSEENIAINRAMLREEAKALGIVPSKEQIDKYITSLPAFRKEDGNFDTKLYQNLTGYYDGVANNPAEQAFRSVIADIIIWETVGAMITTDVAYNTKTQSAIIDAGNQNLKGKTAWLAADKVAAPAAPTEDELKAYWETNKDKYKSEQQRIVSIYTLTPGKNESTDSLMNTADVIMQDFSMADGIGMDSILENAANSPENAEFTYKNEDGSTHITLPLCTEAAAPDALKTVVTHNGKSTTLAAIAFNNIEVGATLADYEAAVKNGTVDKLCTIQQLRGFYLTQDGKAVLIKVEAISPPTVLPFEQAREKALADLNAERADNALKLAAEKLYQEMSEAATKGEGTDSLFAKAAAAGAEVSDFGPCTLGLDSDLPAGLTTQALLTTATGKLCPLVIQTDGARISTITERTITDDKQYTLSKHIYQLPMSNAQLCNQVMLDWLNTAYIRYNVQLAEYVETNIK